MSRGNIFGVIMIYLAISTFLFLGGVRVVESDSSQFISNFVDVEAYEQGVIDPSGGLENTVPTTFTESGADTGLSFIDIITAIQDFLIFVANIIFSPIGLFIGSGIPVPIALIISLPLLVSGVFGLIAFIRGVN